MAARPPAAGAKPVRLRDQQKLDTRRRLLEAARVVFDEHGYSNATIDDIVAAAGASRPTLYLHFQSKAAVAAALYAELDPDTRSFCEQLDALEPPTPDHVRRWLSGVMDWFEAHSVLVEANEQAIVTERTVAQAVFDFQQHAIDAMPRYLGRWEGEDRDRARVRMLGLIFQLKYFCYFAFVHGCEMDRERVLDVMTDQWWAALDPDATVVQ